jgi:hypothetical protein
LADKERLDWRSTMSKINETIIDIDNRLNHLTGDLQAIKDDLKILYSVSTKIDILADQVKSHDAILNGNGTEGLKSRFSRIEEIVNILKEKVENVITLLFGDLNNDGIRSKVRLIELKIGVISAIGGVVGGIVVTILSDTISGLIQRLF